MKTTKIECKSLSPKEPNLDIKYLNVPEEIAMRAAIELSLAFRDVTVTNDETGEVLYSFYQSIDWFTPYLTSIEAIKTVNEMIKEHMRNNENENTF